MSSHPSVFPPQLALSQEDICNKSSCELRNSSGASGKKIKTGENNTTQTQRIVLHSCNIKIFFLNYNSQRSKIIDGYAVMQWSALSQNSKALGSPTRVQGPGSNPT